MKILWLVVLVSLIAVPVLAQEPDDITLTPFTDDAYGISGVIPEGWQLASPGLYIRDTSSTNVVGIAQQSVALSLDNLLPALAQQFGLDAAPESVGTYDTEVLSWTLYKFDMQFNNQSTVADMALANLEGVSYIVLVIATPEEYDFLHENLFIPVLDAFAPLVEAPAEDTPYLQEEVTFANGDITLVGTLTLPDSAGRHPVVVLISGSGAQDRDESLAPMASIKPFRLIADHLTRNGIAVLRYDDRGAGKSTGDYLSSNSADFAEDAGAAIAYLKTRDDIDPTQIGILGHSEGGAIAPLVAQQNPDLAFIISMAGTAVKGSDVLSVQVRRILELQGIEESVIDEFVGLQQQVYEMVAAGGDEEMLQQAIYELNLYALQNGLSGTTPDDPEAAAQEAVEPGMEQITSPWLSFFLGYNPAPYWEQVTVPVLALFGELDVQVDADQNAPAMQAALEKAGNTDVTVIIFETANHLFQDAKTGAVEEYSELDQTFLPGFLPAITDWLLEHVTLPQ